MQEVVLITGATGGLGREFAYQYARDGRSLFLTATNKEKLKELQENIQTEFSIECEAFACNLADENSVFELLAYMEEKNIEVSTLINNAGFAINEKFCQSNLADQLNLVDVNIRALTMLSHTFAQKMAAQKRGAILNVASVAAFMPGVNMASYYASKAYVLSFTRALHCEMKPYKVSVSALCPGPVKTDFWNRAKSGSSMLAHMGVSPKRIVRRGICALNINKATCTPSVIWGIITTLSHLVPPCILARITAPLQIPEKQKE